MTEEPPRRIPRFFSCLIKGPLGCLAFLIGAVAIAILFVPPAVGRWTDRSLERWFRERYGGTLELGDVWLPSLYDDQRIESVILRDPSGDEVLRGSLRAPPLWRLFDQQTAPYGPLELRVHSLRLVEHDDGTTNLARALREREPDSEAEARDRGLRSDVPTRIEVILQVDRLRLVDAAGAEQLFADLSLRGTLDWNHDRGRLELEGGADAEKPAALRANLRLAGTGDLLRSSWQASCTLESAPALLCQQLCPARLPIVRAAGASVDRFFLERSPEALELRIEDEGAELSLRGHLSPDGLTLEPLDGGAARLDWPFATDERAQVVARLLPGVRELRPATDESLAHLVLAGFHWPMDGDWRELSGELRLELGRVLWTPESVLLGGPGGASLRPADADLVLGLTIEKGVLRLVDLRLPLEDGWLELDGSRRLASGHTELSASAEIAGELHDLGHWQGENGALEPAAPEPPPAPDESR